MKAQETKEEAFIRLATKRSNRVLKDISLLGNLSDKRNYSYSEYQVRKIFGAVEEELKQAKSRFRALLKANRRIKL